MVANRTNRKNARKRLYASDKKGLDFEVSDGTGGGEMGLQNTHAHRNGRRFAGV
jgi:hypothetical protein